MLTYPRTSSKYLSTDMIPELTDIAGFVGKRRPDLAEAVAYVQGLPELPLGRVVNNAKVTDHHAVIPTNAPHEADLSPDEARIYDLAARRFLAVFHPEAVFEATTLVTEVAGERFRSSGRVMIEAGWRAVYGESPPDEAQKREEPDAPGDDTPDQNLPPLVDGEKVACIEVVADGRETQPPRRYGEAALLAAMEGAGKLVEDDEARDALKESGIGTPATRAAIIERLIDVGYVVREGRSLVPTQKAIQVIQLLDGHELTSPELTGRWEKRLLDIERGTDSRDSFMDDIAQFTRRTVTYFGDLPKERTRFVPRKLGIRCPRCEATGGPGELIERRANFGCTTWQSTEEPGCGFVVWKILSGKHLGEDILRRAARERAHEGAAGLPLEGRKAVPRNARARSRGDRPAGGEPLRQLRVRTPPAAWCKGRRRGRRLSRIAAAAPRRSARACRVRTRPGRAGGRCQTGAFCARPDGERGATAQARAGLAPEGAERHGARERPCP